MKANNKDLEDQQDSTIDIEQSPIRPFLKLPTKHRHQISALVFSPDGKLLASGSYDTTVRLWDVTTGKQFAVHRQTRNRWGIVSLGFSADCRSVAFATQGCRGSNQDCMLAFLWDVLSDKVIEVGRDRKFFNEFTTPSFAPSEKVVAIGGGSIALFDIDSGRTRARFDKSRCHVVAFAPDASRIFSGCGDGTIHDWDTKTGSRRRALVGHSSWVNSLGFSPDKRFLVSGSDDQDVRLWDVETGDMIRCFAGNLGAVTYVAFVAGSQRFVSLHDREGAISLRLWSVEQERHIATWKCPRKHATAMALSPDGNLLATGDVNGWIEIWQVAPASDDPSGPPNGDCKG